MVEDSLKKAIKNCIKDAASKIDREGFEQEPAYTSALFGKLNNEKVFVKGSSGESLHFKFSVSNDRGKDAAEKLTGIDIGMVFKWENDLGEVILEKAVIAQAKNDKGSNTVITNETLIEQCKNMSKYTTSYIALLCPYDGSVPQIKQREEPPAYLKSESMDFGDYLVDVVMACLDGDTDQKVIKMAKRSDRAITFSTNAPEPNPKPKLKYGQR